MAVAYQDASERTPLIESVSSFIIDAYSSSSKTTSLLYTILTSPRSITSALLLCNDSYLRNSRTLRAKMAPWKSRVARNLLIDKFGTQATALYNSILQNYDYETCSLAGSAAAGYRLAQRAKLQTTLSRDIADECAGLHCCGCQHIRHLFCRFCRPGRQQLQCHEVG